MTLETAKPAVSAGARLPVAHERAGSALFAAVGLLVLGAVLHVIYLVRDCPLALSGDEAHYWEWSRRLDISYYSKGPLVAFLIAAGRALLTDVSMTWTGTEVLAVRLPAIVLSMLTGLGIFMLARQTLRRPGVALAAVALMCTIPILAAGAMLMTIDAPLMCAWTWGLVFLHRGVTRGSASSWLVVGVLTALGILAKYTMILICPTIAALLWLAPAARPQLRQPAPWIAAGIGLAGLVPIMWWNATRGWVSLYHVAGQAGVGGGLHFRPEGVLAYLAGQAGVIGPVWFVALVVALAQVWKQPVATPVEVHDAFDARFLVVATALPFLAFLIFSPITKVQPNWPVMGLAPGVPLLAAWLARGLRAGTKRARRSLQAVILMGAVTGGSMVVAMHHSEWLMPIYARLAHGAPAWDLTPTARYDPTARLRGWPELGHAVGEVLAAERAAGREPFIIADDYQVASEIAFYCPGHPTVYSVASALGGRMSQYDLWPNPLRNRADFVGRPCIYVGDLHRELREDMAQQVPMPGLRKVRTVTCLVRGQLLQIWPVWTCSSFVGFSALIADRAY